LEDKTDLPTEEVKPELIDRIKEIITCDFEIVQHFAGVRPTVKDRDHWWEPIKNYCILNGLGTRGVMLGPAMAKALYENIEYQVPLNTEIERFLPKEKTIELFCIWVIGNKHVDVNVSGPT
jgi:glycine/D-amino acid oxidase-like deaminating enzyme